MIFKLNLFIVLLATFDKSDALMANLDFGYHNYASLTSILQSYAANYPTKTYLYSIGTYIPAFNNYTISRIKIPIKWNFDLSLKYLLL